ncbi:MAG: DUF177 domain-containing protein [Deltaproteobacteria bacterium]|nr:DUF177 domain-containing protein [Deltaproteobacteria bacterium]
MSRHDHDVRAPTPAVERARNREAARRSQRADKIGVPPSLDVQVDDLVEGELVVDTAIAAAAVSELLDEGKEIEWTASGDAKVSLRLEREAGFVRVRGAAHFALRHPCVRCLTSVPFDVPLDVDLRLVKKEGVDAKVPDVDESDEDLEDAPITGDLDDLGIASYAGDTIHLAEVLREQLFLELPMHPACDSARARPTQPCVFDEAGALKKEQQRWVDPRWAGLAKIKDQLAAEKRPASPQKSAPPPVEVVALPGRQTPIALPGKAVPARKKAAPKKAAPKKAAPKKAGGKKAPKKKKAAPKKAPKKKARTRR